MESLVKNQNNMKDALLEYWIEALDYALDDAGVFDVVDKTQRERIAKSLITSAENVSMAMGYDAIPSRKTYYEEDVAGMKREFARQIKDLEAANNAFRKNIGERCGVESHRVVAQDGYVEISRT